MANKKKAAPKTEAEKTVVVKEGKQGQGWRYHEACNHSTKGIRGVTVCGKCGAPFPESKATKAKAAPTNGEVDVEMQAILALFRAGESLATAKKQVQALKENHIASFAAAVGGADKALQLLERLERQA